MDLVFWLLQVLIVFGVGASVGSFLNVVVYRLPAGLSLLYPPSRCPKCLRSLKPYDNVPVLGWLWLRGRCRFCRTAIAARYPLVEAGTGLLFVLIFSLFNLPLPAIGYWVFFSWLLVLALIDLDTLTLPNVLTQSGLVAGLMFQAGLGWVQAGTVAAIASHLMSGLVGAVMGIWLFDLIAIAGSFVFGQAAMGGGDAKLVAMIGAWLGWKYMLLAGFLACVLGAFGGGGAIALGWLSRRQPMPFGPFLAVGAVLATLFGEGFISTYVQVFFPTL